MSADQPRANDQNSAATRRRKPKASRASLRRAFRDHVWPRRRRILLGLGLIVFNRFSGLVLPTASRVVIDDVARAGQLEKLNWLLPAVGGAVLVQAVTSFLLTRLLSVEAQHLIALLRARVQEHVLHLPVRTFEKTTSGALVSRVMNDAEGVRNLVGTGVVHLFGGTLTAIASLVLLLQIDPLLCGIALVPLLLYAFVATKAFAVIRPIFRERGKIQAEVTGRLTESLGGIRVIKGFRQEEREARVFAEGAERLFRNVRRSLTASSLVSSSATLLMGLTSVAVLGFGAQRIDAGLLTVGELFAFVLYLGFMVLPIMQMANVGTQITEALAGLDRIEELMGQPREGSESTRRPAPAVLEGRLRFEDVSFAYEEDQPLLQGIDFEAAPGQVIALVGSSGSGKSTIASLATGFLTPDAGRVLVDGLDLASLDLRSFREHLGVVLQDDFLFEGSIEENVRFARPDASEEEVLAALRASHVLEFTERFPEGRHTLVGERGVKLSGGQRQRLSIARALLKGPRLLILDEATSNLDAESERLIQESFEALLGGRTVLVIAHRLSTIRRADQILVIERGQIVERGRHEELLERAGRYRELYEVQARI